MEPNTDSSNSLKPQTTIAPPSFSTNISRPPRKRRSLIGIAIFLFLVAAVVTAVSQYPEAFRFLGTKSQHNYTISGVPYHGMYELLLGADSITVAAAAMELSYWGDHRFSMDSLVRDFSSRGKSMEALEAFFKENGYETERRTFTKSEYSNAVSFLYPYISQDRKTPVLVFQKRIPGREESVAVGVRVAIGVSDQEQKVVVHDYNFGNNYEIPYKTFTALFTDTVDVALAVWPGPSIASSLAPKVSAYPARSPEMITHGALFAGLGAVPYYVATKDYAMATATADAFVAHPLFSTLPASVRLYGYSQQAATYLTAGDSSKAIKILNEKAIPLNKNAGAGETSLWHPFTWLLTQYPKHDTGRIALPHVILARAYLAEKNITKAKGAIEEALVISPDLVVAQELLKAITSTP